MSTNREGEMKSPGMLGACCKPLEQLFHLETRQLFRITLKLGNVILFIGLYYGCRSDELHDALLYIRKTKDGNCLFVTYDIFYYCIPYVG